MSVVKGVDSEYPPSTASLALAKADGVVGWSGYLPGKNIAHGWAEADFAAIRAAGLRSIAYASGWMDPIAAKLNAAAWSVKGCLDVEGSIRGDGPWVQAWLDASGFGLYGNAPVHTGRTAAFHVLAAYPGHDPGISWPGARPTPPCGWQWAGSVSKYGANVDLCWFDAAIYGSTAQPDPPTPPTMGELKPMMYQRNNGSIYLFCGAALAPLGTGADAVYLESKGVPLIFENKITVAFASVLNALPVLT